MFRRVWKPVAATAVIVPAGYYWYTYENNNSTFEYKVRARVNGKTEMVPRKAPLLPLSAIEARLRENAKLQSHSRGGVTWNYATSSLPSNDPIEDAHSHAIVHRDAGDLLFFSVFDGHGGFYTSQLLSKILINAVSLELANAFGPKDETASKTGVMDRLTRMVWSNQPASLALQDGNPDHVSLVIQNAFASLDKELLNAPARILAENITEEARKTKTIPDLSQHPLALVSMQPAISGSCALMAVVDPVRDDLYVACTGDSRAVAGIWEEDGNGSGHWKVEVLTEDQTGRNPKELQRLQSEHPGEEDAVVMRGRILGGLEPSRAFGDARYKWPRAIQELLSQAFLVGNNIPLRPPPSLFKTPPYVTATPVVTHRKLHIPSQSESSSSQLKFLVIATDGLWDEISSEDVVALVGGHLAGLQGKIAKSELESKVKISTGTPTLDGKDKASRPTKPTGSWVFTDDNVSTHLIRNALGGGDEAELRKLMSIPPPDSRRWRDDITVTVVYWDKDGTAQQEQVPVKAKL